MTAEQRNRAAPKERTLISRMVWSNLDGSSTAEEVEQNGNYS